MSTPTDEGMMADPGSQRPKRGHKPIGESQASAIRTRLVCWRRMPETSRIWLRALASELGTSHQLLTLYLKGLDNWQKADYQRQAKAIRDHARAEILLVHRHVLRSDVARLHHLKSSLSAVPLLRRLWRSFRVYMDHRDQIAAREA